MMKLLPLAGMSGALLLCGCGGPDPVAGNWCGRMVGQLTLAGGKVTSSSGINGVYTLNGQTVTITDERQNQMAFTLTPDGSALGSPSMTLTRCQQP